VTDNRGRFAFANMRPGHWMLHIIDGNLPQNYYFDKESVEFNIAPGQAAEQTFKALPRRRRIQIISQGVTVAASSEKGKTIQPGPEKKIIAPPPQVVKPTETVVPKQKIVEKTPPKETPPQAIVPQQPAARPEQVPCTVVFWSEKLMFGIHHSDWQKKSSADSAAAVLAKESILRPFVAPVVSQDGRVTYRILLGTFKSRKAAEDACSQVRGLK
jgi:hypothetical protein